MSRHPYDVLRLKPHGHAMQISRCTREINGQRAAFDNFREILRDNTMCSRLSKEYGFAGKAIARRHALAQIHTRRRAHR